MKFILGIAAGKGGVGKSSLTVNLALSLQKMGKRVGILDADLYGPSIRRMLPEDLPTRIREEDRKILPAEKNGIKLITVSYFQDSEKAVIVRAPIANGLIKQFFHSVDWGDLDLLLVDFPPGTGDIQLTLLQEASFSGGLVITTPQEVALQDVSKAIALFHQMHVPVLGCVENMSYFEEPVSKQRHFPFGRQGGWRLCQQEGIPFLGEIPIEGEISRCADEGISLLEAPQGQAAALRYQEIAEKIWEQLTAWESLEGKCLKKFELLWN
jgi:ATP-binding protein involved in chromosome partitioning